MGLSFFVQCGKCGSENWEDNDRYPVIDTHPPIYTFDCLDCGESFSTHIED